MKTMTYVMALAVLLAGSAFAAGVASETPNSRPAPEVETLVGILEHYLLMGEAPPNSDLETRAKRVRERWQLVQREGLVEPINGYLSGLPDKPRAIVGMGIQDYFSRYDGAIVTEVLPASPAETAGLRPRDIIMGWNGEQIDLTSPSRDLTGRMDKVEPSGKIRLSVIREGKQQEFELIPTAGAAFTKRRFEIPLPHARCVTILAEVWLPKASDAEILSGRRPIASTQVDCQGAYSSQHPGSQ